MIMSYVVHIVAGSLALIAGYVALYVSKGAPLHRRAGMVFVYSMLTMCAAGALISAMRGVAMQLNIPVAFLTAYLVVTALTTVKPPATHARAFHIGGMVGAIGVWSAYMTFGIASAMHASARVRSFAVMYFIFAAVTTMALVGDVRVLRAGALRGAPRLARHLWRMSTALLIAALSFFIGQQRVFPESIRIPWLLPLPVLAVLVTMLYWLWRVRIRHSLRGMIVATPPVTRSAVTGALPLVFERDVEHV